MGYAGDDHLFQTLQHLHHRLRQRGHLVALRRHAVARAMLDPDPALLATHVHDLLGRARVLDVLCAPRMHRRDGDALLGWHPVRSRNVAACVLIVLDWRAPRAAVLSALEEQHVLGAEHRLEARQARANDVEAEFHDQEDRKINNIHF